MAVDPLTGSGALRALRTAESAADTAAQVLDRPCDGAALLARYESARNDECTAYLTDRARYYGSVRHYATPFWTRRRTAANRSPGTTHYDA